MPQKRKMISSNVDNLVSVPGKGYWGLKPYHLPISFRKMGNASLLIEETLFGDPHSRKLISCCTTTKSRHHRLSPWNIPLIKINYHLHELLSQRTNLPLGLATRTEATIDLSLSFIAQPRRIDYNAIRLGEVQWLRRSSFCWIEMYVFMCGGGDMCL